MLKRLLLKTLTMKENDKYFIVIITSLCLVIIFSFLEISETKKQLKAKNQIYIKNSILKTNQFNKEQEIDTFIDKYLKNIFSSNSDSDLIWLEKHSDQKFFLDTLSKHLNTRIKKQITSNFIIKRLYREKLGANNIEKIIIFGEERFTNSNYQNRVLVIELVLNTESLEVKEIISIKTLNE